MSERTTPPFVPLVASGAVALLKGLDKSSNILDVLRLSLDDEDTKDENRELRNIYFRTVRNQDVTEAEVLAVAFTIACGLLEKGGTDVSAIMSAGANLK